MNPMSTLDLVGQVDATELSSGAVVVSANGPLRGGAARALRDTLLPLAAPDGPFVILDLSNASGIDDEVRAVIDRGAALIRAQGGYLTVVGEGVAG